MAPKSIHLEGGERYEIVRRLGSGGVGVVYEAIDRASGARVALKTLQHSDPSTLYRFKREFRALADLSHKHLVCLHELCATGGEWFFTMELLEGRPFIDAVRPADPSERKESQGPTRELASTPRRAHPPSSASTGQVTSPTLQTASAAPLKRDQRGVLELPRLRILLPQLVDGVAALHAAGYLHRDLKPSNVLVDHADRLVILDFGLVTSVDPHGDGGSSTVGAIMGTVNYMSPEQAVGAAVGPPTDWYAVGVMLFEALTGRRPFEGEPADVLHAKRHLDAPAVTNFVPDAPADLVDLCAALLERDPARRPGEAEVRARLGGGPAAAEPAAFTRAEFFGRADSIAVLQEALTAGRAGKPSVALVSGRSGLGKTALVRHVLQDAERRGSIVLQGRCYEREVVPYKALDELIDDLANHLISLGPEAEALLPRSIDALARLFPVLRRVPAIANPPIKSFEAPDPLERRRQATRALRELFVALAAQAPVILFIDDVQWGDVDGMSFLGEVLRGAGAPGIAVLLTARTDEAHLDASARFLRALGDERDLRQVALAPLSHAEARALARCLIVGTLTTEDRDRLATSIADEADGSPYFIATLARHQSSDKRDHTLRLDEILAEQVRALPAPARALLQVVAVAGRPIELGVARAACPEADAESVHLLRRGGLARTGGPADSDKIETYHDRVRETVTAGLGPDALRAWHQRLLTALEAAHADVDVLLEHCEGAGDGERAAHYAEAAAQKAVAALAFDRAARLFQLALERRPDREPTARRALLAAMADALANGGRGPQAADAYLAAAAGAELAESTSLRQRAADALLRSGHVDRGLQVVRDVTSALGIPMPHSRAGLIAAVAGGRLRIALRGRGFRERPAAEVSVAELLRVDTCWSLSLGLTLVDNFLALSFQTRALRAALDAGEPVRVAQALGLEANFVDRAGGTRARRLGTKLDEQARAIAERTGNMRAIGFTTAASGIAAFLRGQWRIAIERCAEGSTLLSRHGSNVAWEVGTADAFRYSAMYYLGELATLAQQMPLLLREAENRGDLYTQTMLKSSRAAVIWLVDDEPRIALAHLDDVMGRWTHSGFHVQHYYEWLTRIQISLYQGQPEAALGTAEQGFPRLRQAFLTKVQNVRIEAHAARGRALLARARELGRRDLVARAVADAKAIERERMPWGDALAAMLRAGAHAVSGAREAMVADLRRSEALATAADMALHATVARYRLGEHAGDEAAGRAADAWWRAQQVKAPERIACMLAPGW